MSQYARLVNGSGTKHDTIYNSKQEEVPVDSVKFIPVKMSWRGQSWLGPYILAHTSTKWWNHSVQVEVPVRIHDQKSSTNKMKITCMPKAATVYVPGSYKYICLVITDVVEASFPTTEAFYIGNSYKALYDGNFGFGKIGHKILGRNNENPARAASMSDCVAAWRVICKGLLSHVNPGAIEVRLAILSTSRFAGFSVWTDEAKPKKKTSDVEEEYSSLLRDAGMDESEVPDDFDGWLELLAEASSRIGEAWDARGVVTVEKIRLMKKAMSVKFGKQLDAEEDVDHIGGATCADPKGKVIIGDHSLPDWFDQYNTTATMPDRVKYYTWWRTDPLHNYSQALISCTDGEKPALEKFESGEVQYEVTEASDLVRILSYSGVYMDNSSCTGAITEAIDILNRSVGFGSLVLAVTELWRATSGLPLLDYNRISTSWKLNDPQMRKLISLVTLGFAVESPNTTNTAWTDTDFGIVKVVKKAMGITDDKWVDHWYGGVVPWWFVQAVLTKFGGQMAVKTKEPTSVKLNVDDDWLDEVGYHIKANESFATDISVLTSTIMYEKRVQRRASPFFTILTPTKGAHEMKVHWTSWYFNFVNDLPKSGLRRRMKVTAPDFDGVVELNTMVFPDSRRFKGYASPEAFIDGTNRYLLPLDHCVMGGLTWPDPFVDWLKQGLVAIEPHLLNLDVVGAVGAALGHVNKTIIDWLNEKIHGSGSFRNESD